MTNRAFRILCLYTLTVACIGVGIGWNLHKARLQYEAHATLPRT